MKRFFTAFLIPALLIGITPKLSAANKGTQYPGIYPDEVEDFLNGQSKLIFIALECLRRGGATQRQKNEYLTQQLKKFNIELSTYRQRMTEENKNSALKSLSSYKPLVGGISICELRRREAFNQSEDFKHMFAVVNMQKNLRCINKLMRSRSDIDQSHVDKWLSDQQQEWGVTKAAYNRLLTDKLVMAKRLIQAGKTDCSRDEQVVAVSLFLRDHVGDSHSAKIPLNQLTASDFKSQHQRCKDARDYQGCMNYKNNSSIKKPIQSSSLTQDYCPDNYDGWCVAGSGRDRFDLKKIKGWWYKEFEDGDVLYFNPKIFRVPHKGQPSRYIAEKQVFRYYAEPTAGTPGTYTTLGSATTNCTGYGSTINCTTTPPTRMYIPGTSGSSGGIKSIKRTKVVDCKDTTWTFYIDGKPRKWRKDADKKALFTKCSKRSNLPVLEMKL